MKDFQSIKEWLNEQKGKEQTFGCVMMEPEKSKGGKKSFRRYRRKGCFYKTI